MFLINFHKNVVYTLRARSAVSQTKFYCLLLILNIHNWVTKKYDFLIYLPFLLIILVQLNIFTIRSIDWSTINVLSVILCLLLYLWVVCTNQLLFIWLFDLYNMFLAYLFRVSLQPYLPIWYINIFTFFTYILININQYNIIYYIFNLIHLSLVRVSFLFFHYYKTS